MSHATTSPISPARSDAMAVWRPTTLPRSERTSRRTGTPSSQASASGAFATRTISGVTARIAAATRSTMRSPPTRRSPFGSPPNRSFAPPATMAPVTARCASTGAGGGRDTLVGAVARAKRSVFGDRHLDYAHRAKRGLHTVVNEPRELLARRDFLAVGELGHVEIHVPMVEARAYLGVQHAVEDGEVDDHPGSRIHVAGHRHFADVAMSVIVLARAETEDARVLLLRPLRAPIAVRGGEGDATSEESRH